MRNLINNCVKLFSNNNSQDCLTDDTAIVCITISFPLRNIRWVWKLLNEFFWITFFLFIFSFLVCYLFQLLKKPYNNFLTYSSCKHNSDLVRIRLTALMNTGNWVNPIIIWPPSEYFSLLAKGGRLNIILVILIPSTDSSS